MDNTEEMWVKECLEFFSYREFQFRKIPNGCLSTELVLFRDIAKYNTDEDMEESIEETGWKLVHGDVFRPPQYTRLFVAILGSGVQVKLPV